MNDNPKKLPPQEFKSIYSKVPRLCLDLVIRSQEGILFSQRKIEPGQGLWHFPGGTLLLGETVEQAIQRIAFGEVGLKVESPVLLDVMEFDQPENLFFHVVSIVYLVENWSGNLRGSEQGEVLQFFNRIPEPVIREQKVMLLKNKLLPD
jgi:ADP-ribose pyrophosphatase YjhB (NUDIX family)